VGGTGARRREPELRAAELGPARGEYLEAARRTASLPEQRYLAARAARLTAR
jgi:hypothetical protein